MGPVRGGDRLHAEPGAVLVDHLELLLGVANEVVDRHDDGQAEAGDVLHVLLEVHDAAFNGRGVGRLEFLLVDAAVHLECADGGDDDDGAGLEAREAALDVEELLRAEVGAEARLGDGVVAEAQCELGGEDAVAAVGDVGEGTAVHERGIVLQRLHEVGRERIAEEHGHGAVGLELGGGDRLFLAGVADDDAAEAFLQLVEVLREAEDGHDLGGHGDVEAGLAADAVGHTAHAHDDLAEGAVVHVHDALPHDAVRVDPERVAVREMVVDHRRQQVVRGGDGVKIAGEVEVDVLHRHDLGVTAAGRAALDAEARPEGRLAQTDGGAFADAVERVAEADGRRGLALAGRGRRDGGHQHEAARGLLDLLTVEIQPDLGLVLAVVLKGVRGNVEFRRDLVDGQHLRLVGDIDVGGYGFFSHGRRLGLGRGKGCGRLRACSRLSAFACRKSARERAACLFTRNTPARA